MKLEWKKSTSWSPQRGPTQYAHSDGYRYEVSGTARSFTARVYRFHKARPPRMLLAYDDDRAQKCMDWCQRIEDSRTVSQAKADQVRPRRQRTPRLRPRALTLGTNIG